MKICLIYVMLLIWFFAFFVLFLKYRFYIWTVNRLIRIQLTIFRNTHFIFLLIMYLRIELFLFGGVMILIWLELIVLLCIDLSGLKIIIRKVCIITSIAHCQKKPILILLELKYLYITNLGCNKNKIYYWLVIFIINNWQFVMSSFLCSSSLS